MPSAAGRPSAMRASIGSTGGSIGYPSAMALSSAGEGLEPGRAHASPRGRGVERDVFQFLTTGGLAEQETAAAHVATADERDWVVKACAKRRPEHVHVLVAGNAA